MIEPVLVVIAGPTAVGKTSASITIAKELNTEIISADARQFYKEMSIGTAKPTQAELTEVPHHFIGSHSIFTEYSVGDYEQEALQALNKLFQTKPVAVVTGGSGLYIKALCDGLDEMPAADLQIRDQLSDRLKTEGLPALVQDLESLDPVYAASVDKNNPQRVMRGLEVCLSTGRPYSEFRTGKKANRPFRIIKICLSRNREELYRRIDLRVDKMLAEGLLDEIKNLYPHRHLNALQTVGYTEFFDYLDGKFGLEEAIRLVKRNSRRYSKRQLTWFRKDPEFTWFAANDLSEVLRFIRAELGF